MRRAHADAGAVANFIGLVEKIDHVEAHGDICEARDMEVVRDAEVQRIKRGQAAAIWRAVDVAAQTTLIEEVGVNRRVPE